MGQILFRDSNQRMIEGKQVLILTDSVTTGALLAKSRGSSAVLRWTCMWYLCSIQCGQPGSRYGCQVNLYGFLICRIIKDMQPKTARCAGRGRNWMELSIHSVL